jgi:hypothetical protein
MARGIDGTDIFRCAPQYRDPGFDNIEILGSSTAGGIGDAGPGRTLD